MAALLSGTAGAALAGGAHSPAPARRAGLVAAPAAPRGRYVAPGPRATLGATAGGKVTLAAYAAGSHPHARLVAKRLMHHRFHWSVRRQYTYLNRLWERESGWNRFAYNPASGAYGIPQAVPGSKMASAGPHWRTSAKTQIKWGLRYIRGRYGSPRHAWAHEVSYGWY